MAEYVRTERDGWLAVVTVDRPGKRHALDWDVMAELTEAFRDLAREDVHVVVLRTTGEKAFVAGADLTEFEAMDDPEAFRAFQEAEYELNEAILTHPAVVVAAVDGGAYGGGFELALAADLVVAEEGAEFAFPEVTRGLIPGATGGAQWLPRLVGLSRAVDLIATGRAVSAAEAADVGLVNRLVDDGEAFDAALALADDLLSNAPLAVRAAKRVCRESFYGDVSTVLAYGTEVTVDLFRTGDAAEGFDSFVEGREPEFEGW